MRAAPSIPDLAGAWLVPRSDVIAEHQLLGGRVQIDLVGEIGEAEATDAVLEQRERDHQRHEAATVLGDTKTHLDFRTHRHPRDERAERLGEEGVALVSAVVAHLLAEQQDETPRRIFWGSHFDMRGSSV